MRKSVFCNLLSLIALLFSCNLYAHGVIESPPSRQQFCGVETKPHDIYGTVTHEKCRPILTKEDGTMDNSIYNFMGVLTHTTGKQGRSADNLPQNVCGFNSETWGGGKTPWDKANDWPTSLIASGANQFVWNIRWGAHYGDTEEFVYYITKPNFVFDKNRELTWDDFEPMPFCLLKYSDANPNANPNVVPDKPNDKFHTTCVVPAREGRAVIYGEWGRNYWTFERFHACMDVEFSDSDTPTPPQISAQIGYVPELVTGASEIMLNGSESQGENLTYQWTVNAKNGEYYSLVDADKVQARLILNEPQAEQVVSISLTVAQDGFTSMVTKEFRHYPTVSNNWQLVGDTNINETFVAGDTVQLRMIDRDGYDHYLPQNSLVLTEETAKAENWSYALASAVNDNNSFDLKIGVLNSESGTIEPIHSATQNKIYVGSQSNINNAYVVFEKQSAPVPCGCKVQKRSGASAYWLGYDVFADFAPIVLDFSGTGIDLNQIIIDQGVFQDVTILSNNRLLINVKPSWVSNVVPGYIGFRANNYSPLSTNLIAACHAG